jgi:hypothetical protein
VIENKNRGKRMDNLGFQKGKPGNAHWA